MSGGCRNIERRSVLFIVAERNTVYIKRALRLLADMLRPNVKSK